MSDQPTFWFPAKRYGWGWGLPVRWQGWLVFAAYAALLYGGIYYLKSQRSPLMLLIYVTALTAVLIVIVAAKGERPQSIVPSGALEQASRERRASARQPDECDIDPSIKYKLTFDLLNPYYLPHEPH
jgi:hypothetical protein